MHPHEQIETIVFSLPQSLLCCHLANENELAHRGIEAFVFSIIVLEYMNTTLSTRFRLRGLIVLLQDADA